jgi:hypothetical protein
MKRCIPLLLFISATCAQAEDIDLVTTTRMSDPDRFNVGDVAAYPALATLLTQSAQRRCPAGFEKVREYAAPEGEAWYLHFVVRCITPPATPVASAKPEPK